MGVMQFTQRDRLEEQLTEREGDAIEVGFRPSGELHVGNLTSIATAFLLGERFDLRVQVTCCDTDWDANTHEQTVPDNNRVFRHFFEREERDGLNMAEWRYRQAEPYIEAMREYTATTLDVSYMSDIQRETGFRESLHRLMGRMEEFNRVWGGQFRERWKSPVAPPCDCGCAPAKGAAYAEDSRTFAFPCWHVDCPNGFHEVPLDADNELGIYYLVDPIRDTTCRDTKIHVFGGDYRDARKGQKTSKIHKVEKVTEIANGETPLYMIAPLLVSGEGLPLSKSKGTGIFLSELPAPDEFVPSFMERVDRALAEGEETLVVNPEFSERSEAKLFN